MQCVQLVPDIWKTSSQQEELTPAKRACRSGTRSSNDHRNGHVVQPYQPPSDAEASQTEGCSYGNATQPESTAVNDENLQISSSTAALVKEVSTLTRTNVLPDELVGIRTSRSKSYPEYWIARNSWYWFETNCSPKQAFSFSNRTYGVATSSSWVGQYHSRHLL